MVCSLSSVLFSAISSLILSPSLLSPTLPLSPLLSPSHLAHLFSGFNNTIKPANWKRSIYELDESDAENNGLQNEDLIVWMRPAALSSFRKLHRRIDQSQHGFALGMPKGNYRLTVEYSKSSYNIIK